MAQSARRGAVVPDEIQKETETTNDGGNRRGLWRRSENVGKWKDEASEAVEGRERVKEEKAGGGERRADGRERVVDA